MIKLKRAYEATGTRDGYRVLVERLWPRGIRKENLDIDEWMKAIAPSHELRKWFAHDPSRWQEFEKRYRRELASGTARELLQRLVHRARSGSLTLVYSARDEEHNSAVVLLEEIERLVPRTHAEHAPHAHP